MVSALLSEIEKDGGSDLMKSAYTKILETGRNTGRTEHGYECNTMHAKIDAMLDEAVVNYRVAIEKSQRDRHNVQPSSTGLHGRSAR
jgi:hypothetical protein